MKNWLIIIVAIFTSILLFSCQTVTKKIDEKITLEEKELSKWLNQPQSELKILLS